MIALLLAAMVYPDTCYCNPANCHPVPCAELHRMRGNAWIWKFHIFWDDDSKTLPSGDGQCHVCHWETGNSRRGLCVFVPQGNV